MDVLHPAPHRHVPAKDERVLPRPVRADCVSLSWPYTLHVVSAGLRGASFFAARGRNDGSVQKVVPSQDVLIDGSCVWVIPFFAESLPSSTTTWLTLPQPACPASKVASTFSHPNEKEKTKITRAFPQAFLEVYESVI